MGKDGTEKEKNIVIHVTIIYTKLDLNVKTVKILFYVKNVIIKIQKIIFVNLLNK